jgi:linoleoyl-CoA desaturase
MIFKTILLVGLWMGSYAALVTVHAPLIYFFMMWALLGISIALVTMNVGHDAIHGAYSDKKWVNDLLSHTFNLNGASAYMWRRMHNIAHHTHTNVHGHDEDISSTTLLRFSPSDPIRPIHKHQHWYAFALYSLSTLSWVFVKDYVKFFKNDVGNPNGKKHEKQAYVYLFLYKLINYTLFLVLPLCFINQPWYLIVAGFVVMHLVSGLYLALIFMLAHTVESTSFPQPGDTGVVSSDWYVHQLQTTMNFSTRNPVAAFLTGGLNQQVEHHLFPNICSTHYPSLSLIVQQTAREYNIPYLEEPSFMKALVSHIRFLKRSGQAEEVVEEATTAAA